jgi:hypothetical protein
LGDPAREFSSNFEALAMHSHPASRKEAQSRRTSVVGLNHLKKQLFSYWINTLLK